jgi:hypothetical protein
LGGSEGEQAEQQGGDGEAGFQACRRLDSSGDGSSETGHFHGGDSVHGCGHKARFHRQQRVLQDKVVRNLKIFLVGLVKGGECPLA